MTQSLGAQSLQLPKIGADLEKIAAALAEAQKAAAGQIGNLEAQLQQLDQLIGQAIDMEKDPNLTAAERDALNAFIRTAEDDAVRDTKAVLAQLHSIRDGYSGNLHAALATLHTDGYDPPASRANPGIPGIGAADLGEVVELPDGRLVAIFGDSFAGDKVGAGTHYPSVAVPVTFDEQGRPHFGAPLTGPDGSLNVLFPPPPQAAGKNTLPAGSIRMRDGPRT